MTTTKTKKNPSMKATNGQSNSHQNHTKVVVNDDLNAENEQLPPITLSFVVFTCSSIVFILCLRDFWMTGKNIFGSFDHQYMTFTKSLDWFIDTNGWKSTQGGFSAIQSISTDENNMGGFFIRKLTGGTGCIIQLHKIIPLLFIHEPNAYWYIGHYQPLLLTAFGTNIAIILFYLSYYDTLLSANAHHIPLLVMSLLSIETIVMFIYWITIRRNRHTRSRLPAIAMPIGKTPNSFVSNITTRTTCIVTSLICIVSIRDLFFPGYIIDIIPRDDIYLEWTNALLHSPPYNSPEGKEYGIEAPLYIGDKFIAQLGALYIIILCIYKYISTIYIRFGNDGSGVVQAKMIWKVSCIGDIVLLICFRLFSHAAKSASYDTRYHLILLSYEAIIFGLYGYC